MKTFHGIKPDITTCTSTWKPTEKNLQIKCRNIYSHTSTVLNCTYRSFGNSLHGLVNGLYTLKIFSKWMDSSIEGHLTTTTSKRIWSIPNLDLGIYSSTYAQNKSTERELTAFKLFRLTLSCRLSCFTEKSIEVGITSKVICSPL